LRGTCGTEKTGDNLEDFESVKLTKRQIEKIRVYMKDDRVLNAAVASALSTRKKSPRARRLANGDNREVGRSILDIFSRLPMSQRDRLRATICEKYGFCKNRSDYHLVVTIVPVVLGLTAPFIAVPISVWVILLKNRSLELFCDCDPDQKSEFIKMLTEKLFNRQ